jgi:hypothetical protein
MNLDSAIDVVALGLAAALLSALTYKRVFRKLPVFFGYLCFYLVGGLVGQLVYRCFPDWYVPFFLFDVAFYLLLIFAVLAELGKNLLRFNREPVPNGHIAVLIFVWANVLIFTLSRWGPAPGRSVFSVAYFLGMRAVEFLQFAGFLALISWSSLRKLCWPPHEWRIAIGLGFSTFVWFLVSLLHSHWSNGPIYHQLDQAGQAADLAALAYWLQYFSIQAGREAPARNADAKLHVVSNSDRVGRASRLGLLTPLPLPGSNRNSGEGVHP